MGRGRLPRRSGGLQAGRDSIASLPHATLTVNPSRTQAARVQGGSVRLLCPVAESYLSHRDAPLARRSHVPGSVGPIVLPEWLSPDPRLGAVDASSAGGGCMD